MSDWLDKLSKEKDETPRNEKGEIHGMKRVWYKNGQLKYEFPFQNDKRHGISKWWYENGHLQHEFIYHQDQQHGIARHWYDNGQLEYEEYFLYDEEVTEEEYRKHELVEELAGV